jgi:hypothetical protein
MGGKSDKKPLKSVKAVVPVKADEDVAVRAPGRSPGDWTYHGVGQRKSSDDQAHIFVEDTVFGLTEHENATTLRELNAPTGGGFYWGYNGSGPAWAATAILADALSPDGPAPAGLDPMATTQDATLCALRADFIWDVTSQLCDEWRLRRDAVLRWVRGWYAEQGLTNLPPAAAQLPPADPHRRKPQTPGSWIGYPRQS